MPDIASASPHHRLRRPGFIDSLQGYGGLTTGLTHYWQLEESSGLRADLITASPVPLLNNGSPSNATGKKGNGVSLAAASTQYLYTPTTPVITLNTDRTIAMWIKPTATSISTTQRGIASVGTANIDGVSAWILIINVQSNTGKLGIYHSANGYSSTGATSLSAGNWYHLAYTRIGTTWTLYLNGTSELSATLATESGNSAIFYVGSGYNGIFDGVIDEVGIWSRGLSSTEVGALYNSGNGATYPWFT